MTEMPNPGKPDETREQILWAAKAVFSEKGFKGATTRAIAEAAGVNEVTIFRHFQSKKNLLNAVITQHSALPDLAEQMANRMSGDYHEDMQALAAMFTKEIFSRQEVLRLMLCEAGQTAELQQLVGSIPARLRSMLTIYFKQQVKAGIVRSDLDPEIMAQGFFGIFFSYGINQSVLDHPLATVLDQDMIVQQFVTIFVDGTKKSG